MPAELSVELEEVLSHYDLGEVVRTEKDKRGFVNESYTIETIDGGRRGRYFLRKYRPGIREEEIQFEHSIINRVAQAGACPVARIHATRDGKSYLRRVRGTDDRDVAFYAVFSYLPGEDRYTWVNPKCTERELEASAVVLAQFHNSVVGWSPHGRRVEPRILELLPAIAKNWAACPARSRGTVFDAYLRDNLDLVDRSIASALSALSTPEARRLPEIVIHCDYHPGNLRFQGDHVSGLCDFDWAKVDWRAFDVALAIWYFCTSWEEAQDGRLSFDRAGLFLYAYQHHLHEHAGIGPLNASEATQLPYLVSAANLYVLNWAILDYCGKNVDPHEYLVYLRHSVRFASWFEAAGTRQGFTAMLARL